MRLIDADKLKEQFDYYKGIFCRGDIINIINEAETVYPATKSNDDLVSREYVLKELMAHQYSKEFCIEHHIDYSINSGMARIVVNEAPSILPYVHCENCTFKNFTENVIDKVVKIMSDNDISDFDELAKRLTERDKQ